MSTPFNAAATIKDSGLESGAYLKIKEGQNKIRLLSEALFHTSYFKGTKTNKFVCWVFDWSDGKVKLYFMPKTVLEAIGALQGNPDYAFETVPMPYDVTINAKDAGTKEVVYSVTPARQNTEVPIDALNQMDGKEPIVKVLEKLLENDAKDPAKQPPVSDTPPLPEYPDHEVAV